MGWISRTKYTYNLDNPWTWHIINHKILTAKSHWQKVLTAPEMYSRLISPNCYGEHYASQFAKFSKSKNIHSHLPCQYQPTVLHTQVFKSMIILEYLWSSKNSLSSIQIKQSRQRKWQQQNRRQSEPSPTTKVSLPWNHKHTSELHNR